MWTTFVVCCHNYTDKYIFIACVKKLHLKNKCTFKQWVKKLRAKAQTFLYHAVVQSDEGFVEGL